MKKRHFTAPAHAQRCCASRSPLKDGSGARCMARRAPNSAFCRQHAQPWDVVLHYHHSGTIGVFDQRGMYVKPLSQVLALTKYAPQMHALLKELVPSCATNHALGVELGELLERIATEMKS